jgi:hypothetical protein
MLPDRKTRLALGGVLPYLVVYWSSRRGPVEKTGTIRNLMLDGVYDGICSGDAHVVSGEGFKFDGVSDSVVGAYVPEILSFGTGEHSLSCWFQTSTLAFQNLIAKETGNGWESVLYLRNSNPYIRFRIGATWTNNMSVRVDDGNWHLVTASRIGTTLYVFLDGRQVDSVSSSTESSTNTSPLTVGGGLATLGLSTLNGAIDEVMVTNGKGIDLVMHQAIHEIQRHLFGV